MIPNLTSARSPVRRYGVAVASVALALLVSIWVPTPLREKHHSALFFAAVIVTTINGGLGPGLVAIALATVAIQLFLVRPFHGDLERPDPIEGQPGFSEAAFVASVVRVGVFAASALLVSLLNRRRLRAEVAAQAADLELRVARQVQQKLFPAEAPHVPGFDVAGVAAPAGATGGDYFDFFPLGGGRLGVAVADVSGHGLGPALLMAATRAYLRALARADRPVGETLTLANRVLCEDTGDERFVALLFSSLDPRTRTFAYAGAGQHGYLLDAAGKVTPLDPTGPPLGIDPDVEYPTAPPRVLEAGQVVLVFTDGLTEARSPDGSFFGAERTLAVAAAARGRPASEMARALCGAVREFSVDHPPADDITVVVIRARPYDPGTRAAADAGSVSG